MSSPTDDPEKLASELAAGVNLWRAEHSDLPVVLLVHSRVRRIVDGLKKKRHPALRWASLKRGGDQLARSKSLFIAAEATGHLPQNRRSAEAQRIRDELAVVIEEGSSLHKVRALRSMAFVAGDECVPLLEKGLRDASPWVQATALHTLLRFNLRRKGPRGILINFLLNNFRESLKKRSVLSLGQFVRNFFLNKGLLVALSREPGGRALAVLSALLWAGSLVGAALFVALYGVYLIVYSLLVIALGLPLVILLIPVLVRMPKESEDSPTRRPSPWAILDYALAALILLLFLPGAVSALAIYLTALLAVSAASIPVQKKAPEHVEYVRGTARSLLAFAAAAHAYLLGRGAALPLLISLLAAAQFAWVAPRLASLFRSNEELIRWWATAVREFFGLAARGALRRIKTLAGKLSAWLRSNAWRLARRAAVFGLVVAALNYASSRAGSYLPESTLKGVEVQYDYLRAAVPPYLYLLGGVALMLLNCGLYLFAFCLLWDEIAILNLARSRTLMRRYSHFKSAGDFLAYVIQVVKNAGNPINLRTRAVLALAQLPLANPASVSQLMELAEEDLPPKVQDAVYQIIDAAEKRMQRGQMSSLNFDMGLINRQVEPILSPGSILRRRIIAWLCLLLLLAAALGASRLGGLASQPFTARMAMAELAAGALLLLSYVFTPGKISGARKWSLMLGCGLLAASWAYPIQEWLLTTTRPHFFFTFGVAIFDGGTARSLIVPVILFSVAAQVAHTVYLLENDVLLPEDGAAAEPNVLTRRLRRLQTQPLVLNRVLPVALVAVAFQSMPLQEYVDLRGERMPYFAQDPETDEVKLRDIPLDGRVVRVALVAVEDGGEEPRLSETFPTAYVADAEGRQVPKDPRRIYLQDRTLIDEVWVSSVEGTLTTWEIQAGKCLSFAEENDRVTFHPPYWRCLYGKKLRLVALVYNRRRSQLVTEKATGENLEDEFNGAQVGDRLLTSTLSPFVRPVWGPVWEPNYPPHLGVGR